SPHPILTSAVDTILASSGVRGRAIASLRREQPERRTLLAGLGALHVHGRPLDAKKLFPEGGRRLGLPKYPWQGASFWVTPARKARAASAGHPLLGARVPLAGGSA